MKTIADFEFNKAPLSEGIILVSRIIRPDFPVQQVNAQLRLLVAEARQTIQADDDIETQVSILLKLFYRDWLFSGVTGVYSLSEALWLDKVLIARQGTCFIGDNFFACCHSIAVAGDTDYFSDSAYFMCSPRRWYLLVY